MFKKRLLIILLLLFAIQTMFAIKNIRVNSPDNNVTVNISIQEKLEKDRHE